MKDNYKCPLCGSKRFKRFLAMREYGLARCLSCDMVWDPNPPKDLKSVYRENYFVNDNPKGGYANYFEGMNVNKRTFHERIKRINKKILARGRMLDVGCALGDSLIEAKRLGWKNLYGVEMSEYASKKAGLRGLNIKEGTLDGAKFPDNYFDIVTLQDVIEHIKDPKEEVREIYRILKPGGFVFIVSPDVDGLWAKLLGKAWYHYKPREHIMYFSQKTLKTVLENAGFMNIETGRTYHIMSLEYIFSRLRYYTPWVFERLLGLVKGGAFGNFSFRVYAGEIEAWGQK